MKTQNPQISGCSSLVPLFQSSSSSRTSSSIGLPPSLAISALISPSSFSRVCLVYFKDPNFSSSVTQYFFNSTSTVRCRRIPDWWQLRLILKFSFVSQYPNIFLCNPELSSYKQTTVWYPNSYLQSSGQPPILLYITHDQVLQLQNKHRQKVHSLPFCFITYHHNCAQCTTAEYCYMCSMLFPIKYYMH